jgi:hypothetical protein
VLGPELLLHGHGRMARVLAGAAGYGGKRVKAMWLPSLKHCQDQTPPVGSSQCQGRDFSATEGPFLPWLSQGHFLGSALCSCGLCQPIEDHAPRDPIRSLGVGVVRSREPRPGSFKGPTHVSDRARVQSDLPYLEGTPKATHNPKGSSLIFSTKAFGNAHVGSARGLGTEP